MSKKLTAAQLKQYSESAGRDYASANAGVLAIKLRKALAHISALEGELFTEVTHNKEILQELTSSMHS